MSLLSLICKYIIPKTEKCVLYLQFQTIWSVFSRHMEQNETVLTE